jgi:prevent-host-death family protein
MGRRYKRYGELLTVDPPRKLVEEISVRDLSRDTSRVLARVREGRRAIVTSRGTPVAVILEVDEAIGLCGTAVLRRNEAERRLFGEELGARIRARLSARRPRDLEWRNRRRVERELRERGRLPAD